MQWTSKAMAVFFATLMMTAPAMAAEPQIAPYHGVTLGMQGPTTFTLYVDPASPAYEAGLRADEVITAIEGKGLDGLTRDAVEALLDQPEGETVTLQVQRKRGEETVQYVQREVEGSDPNAVLSRLEQVQQGTAYGLSDEEVGGLVVLGILSAISYGVCQSDVACACRKPCDRCDDTGRTADCASCAKCIRDHDN